MHDLRLVGVHEDGEHLLLTDAEGGRFLLAIDDAVRAAVRRDRPHLGQLQIEIEGGLRPRDVQARIRAGATAEEVASLAGWPVEKVRRYEGPVLAEREHVAGVAREVRLRRRGGSVTLGAEVSRRLTARGVDLDHVRWDAWRVDGDPWTVTVTFPAGGRERSARWHLDLTARSVSPGDDEARWLSEDQPEGEGPLAGARLSAVPLAPTPISGAQVYDVEVDGGIGSSEAPRSGSGEALDLMSAMRARRQAGRGGRRRPGHPDAGGGTAGDGTGLHPAGRRRPREDSARPEPLELDPSLMDAPPAAHPPLGLAPEDAPATTAEVTPLPSATSVSPLGLPLAPPASASTTSLATPTSPAAPATPASPATPSTSPSAEQPANEPSGASPRHWPLAEEMRRTPPPTLLPRTVDDRRHEDDPQPGTLTVDPSSPAVDVRDVHDAEVASPAESSGRHRHDERRAEQTASGETARSTPPAPSRSSRRPKRSSVPSWDDIMFGAKQD